MKSYLIQGIFLLNTISDSSYGLVRNPINYGQRPSKLQAEPSRGKTRRKFWTKVTWVSHSSKLAKV